MAAFHNDVGDVGKRKFEDSRKQGGGFAGKPRILKAHVPWSNQNRKGMANIPAADVRQPMRQMA